MGVSNKSTMIEVYWLPELHQGICHWVPFSWALGGVIILPNAALCLCYPLGIKSFWWLQCSESMDKITECRQKSIVSQDSLAENTREAGKDYTERKWGCYLRILTFKWKINSRVAVGRVCVTRGLQKLPEVLVPINFYAFWAGFRWGLVEQSNLKNINPWVLDIRFWYTRRPSDLYPLLHFFLSCFGP